MKLAIYVKDFKMIIFYYPVIVLLLGLYPKKIIIDLENIQVQGGV